MSCRGVSLHRLALLIGACGTVAVLRPAHIANADGSERPTRPQVADLQAALSDPSTVVGLDRVAELLSGSATSTTNVNVVVESGGVSQRVVLPGAEVPYEVVATLSDDANLGLALIGFTLAFDGGDLTHAAIPTGEPTPGCDNAMINFTLPWGLTNPDEPCPPSCGFGGTIIRGDLIQLGGAQNTINNTPDVAPFPIGPVLTGVAQPSGCGPQTIANGSLIAPNAPGVYTLELSELFANVIRAGETGDDFWAADPAGVGTITNLVIDVVAALASADACFLPAVTGATLTDQLWYLTIASEAATTGGVFFVVNAATSSMMTYNYEYFWNICCIGKARARSTITSTTTTDTTASTSTKPTVTTASTSTSTKASTWKTVTIAENISPCRFS